MEEKIEKVFTGLTDLDEIAERYLRIAGRWYKKVIDVRGNPNTEKICKADILEDYGKADGNYIISKAKKYINETCVPENINYEESIETASGDLYYNTYKKIPHMPAEGDWSTIEEHIRHIFGEQYELGLDYIELLYLYPKLHLPALLLVSKEQGTGKSTFCHFIHWIFGANVTMLEASQFRGNFDSDWKDKLVLYIEEAILDRPDDMERIKSLILQETSKMEGKNKDRKEIPQYLKFIFCSNNEEKPVKLDNQDTRFWVLKIPALPKGHPTLAFDQALKKEIPAFLWHLQHRELSTKNEDRLWFRRDLIETDAWRNIVRCCSQTALEKKLPELLLQIFDETNSTELSFTPKDLSIIIDEAKCKREVQRDGPSIIKLLRKWNLSPCESPSYYTTFFPRCLGHEDYSIVQKTGRYYTFRREFLEQLNKQK